MSSIQLIFNPTPISLKLDSIFTYTQVSRDYQMANLLLNLTVFNKRAQHNLIKHFDLNKSNKILFLEINENIIKL